MFTAAGVCIMISLFLILFPLISIFFQSRNIAGKEIFVS
jgi:hypothetical protein